MIDRLHQDVLDVDLEEIGERAVRPRKPPPSGQRNGAAKHEDRAPATFLPTIAASSFAGKPKPSRPWAVEDLIPAYTVTMLSGDGGTGKSLLALQLAVAAVGNVLWLGREVAPGPVLFLTAEDDVDELHRRLVDVARETGVDLGQLGGLTLVSLADDDAILAVPDTSGGNLVPTPRYQQLETTIGELKPALIILDTLADIFGGNEIDRRLARQFIALLRRLALRYQTTVVVLAHPSLSGMASGSGMSGSTGWSNSVRSRLYLDRIRGDNGDEPDPDARVLRLMKSNYAGKGAEIRVRWHAGIFTTLGTSSDRFTVIAAQAKAERVFLDMLAAYEVEGRYVSASAGHGFAPAVFASDARAEGLPKKGLADAMNRLFEAGRIKSVEYGAPSRRLRRLTIVSAEEKE